MTQIHHSRMRRMLAGAVLALSAGAPAAADPVADFYRGRQVEIYVGYSVGGGYDTYARVLGRHIARHIPGTPDIVVKNRPGAGSLVLTNELANSLRRDGTVFGTVGRGVVMEPWFGNKKARFDPTKFSWIGSMNNEVSVCASWHTSEIRSVDDMFAKRFIVGGTGPGADTDVFPLVFNNVLGAKMKLVTGYPGGNEINFAMERGEVDGRCGWSWSSVKTTRAEWLRDKKVRILIQMSTAKHPELPDVPFVMDYAKSDRDRKILEIIYARQVWGRPFFGPPDVPAERTKALQKAFMDTMKDPKFLAEADKLRLEVAAVSGPEIADMIRALAATPPDVLALASAATRDASKTSIGKAVIPTETLIGSITRIGGGGRSVTFAGGGKEQKVRVSGRRTKITVGGAAADRAALKQGMACELTHQGSAAQKIACK